MNTLDFFKKMFGYSEGMSYIWTLPNKITYQCGNVTDLANCAAKRNESGEDVYFSVGLTEKPIGKYERAKNDAIIGIPALWVDIDIADNTHAAENLPPDYESAKALLPEMFKPSIIVFSGHGIHAYYIFREILDTRTVEEKQFAKNLLKRLQSAVRKKAESKGWHVDSTIDLCRVLRVPGTINRKNGMNVKCEVREFDSSAAGYNPIDFDDWLPPVNDSVENVRSEKFERRGTDGDALLMLANCTFLQNWQMNYKNLPEPVWKAACTNLMRGVNGEKIILPIVNEWLGEKFNEQDTLKKLDHYLNDCTPQTCQYIKEELQFTGCENCQGIKAPCAWSLAKIPQAVAIIRSITMPSVDNTLNDKVLKSLAILKKERFSDYLKFKEKCRGKINLKDLEREVKKAGGIEQNNLPATVDGGVTLAEGQTQGEVTTCQIHKHFACRPSHSR